MSVDISEWLSLVLRWLHLMAGIAWIGASFYFVWLDNHLRRNDSLPEDVAGELWAVHGGGFYNNRKFLVAPAALPPELHWFKWEAYVTWLSGFSLFCLIYYIHADIYLIDHSRADLSISSAIGISLALLAGGWLIYDGFVPLKGVPRWSSVRPALVLSIIVLRLDSKASI